MEDPHKLERFIAAQDPVYAAVLTELAAGRKRSHWMWFVFPQLAGLGRSDMARQYAIASLDEARAYLAHPVLGARLRECCTLLAGIEARSAHEILGDPDDLKFHSSLTLFAQAAPGEPVFRQCLDKYFAGVADAATLALMS
jgi:uncharacterized protein (DUF1810 family)